MVPLNLDHGGQRTSVKYGKAACSTKLVATVHRKSLAFCLFGCFVLYCFLFFVCLFMFCYVFCSFFAHVICERSSKYVKIPFYPNDLIITFDPNQVV